MASCNYRDDQQLPSKASSLLSLQNRFGFLLASLPARNINILEKA
jgi:hypothetical protein